MNALRYKNLELLEKKYSGMKDLIEKKRQVLLEEEQLQILVEKAETGDDILKMQHNGRTIYLGGKRNPRIPAINQISMLGKIEHTAPVFVVGIGNILYLQELFQIIEKDTMVLIYEPSFSVFDKQLEVVDFSFLFEKGIVALLVGGINDEAKNFTALIDGMLRGDRTPIMKNFILPNYEEICQEKVHSFIKQLADTARRYSTNVYTAGSFSKVIVDNIFHNADYVRTGYKAGQLPSAFPKNIPAIVVAAGPSLNKNIKQLKKAKNKSFIIAVDTAIKPLLKENIIPDMFATLDGKKPLELVVAEKSRDIPLITNIDSSKILLEYHTGKKFFYNQGIDYVNEIYKINKEPLEGLLVGGSVATLAFSIACHMGFQRVVLVGQDLAYTGNKSHADGTFNEIMKTEDTSKYKMVPGNYEEEVPTLKNLDEYRCWFERFIENWKANYELRVINATEGGARIAGTELMTLEEVIQNECREEVNIDECFDNLEPVFDEEKQKKILEFFQNTPRDFEKMENLAAATKRLYQKLGRMCANANVDKNVYLKLLKKIKKNVQKIERPPYYQLVSMTIYKAEQILKTGQYLQYKDFKEEGKRIAEKGIIYVGLVEECARLLKQMAEDTLAKLPETAAYAGKDADVIENKIR